MITRSHGKMIEMVIITSLATGKHESKKIAIVEIFSTADRASVFTDAS
jgi:hypothetical protein